MQIRQTTLAYELFVEARALYSGKTPEQIKKLITPDAFESQLRLLYEQWMAGEFSFGRFTELIQVAHWELWQILEEMGLPIQQ